MTITDLKKILREQARQIEALKRLVEKQSREIAELRAVLKIEPFRVIPKKPVGKAKLTRFVKQNKSTKSIADYFKASERTIYRRIKEYGLKGLRPKGRKPFVEKPKIPEPKEKWISVERYIDSLSREYHFVNIRYPHAKFINPKTLVCSNEKENPKGKFTTVGVYYITLQSDVYFIYQTRIKYSDRPADFEEIYRWIKRNALDMVSNLWIDTAVAVVKVIAFTFLSPETKPERVSNLEGI